MLARQEEYDFGNNFLQTILDWIDENLEPEDVFNDEKLKDWALDNGYEKEEL